MTSAFCRTNQMVYSQLLIETFAPQIRRNFQHWRATPRRVQAEEATAALRFLRLHSSRTLDFRLSGIYFWKCFFKLRAAETHHTGIIACRGPMKKHVFRAVFISDISDLFCPDDIWVEYLPVEGGIQDTRGVLAGAERFGRGQSASDCR